MDSNDIWHQLGPSIGPPKNVSEISVGTLRGPMGAEISAGQKKKGPKIGQFFFQKCAQDPKHVTHVTRPFQR